MLSATRFSFPLAAVVVLAGSAGASTAGDRDDLYDRYFSNVLAGQPCFARTYTDAHLGKHPGQQVRMIEIDLSKQNSDGTPNSPERFELGFALMLKDNPEWFGQNVSCKAEEAGFDCFTQGSGGDFKLTPLADGGLQLQTTEDGLVLEGSQTIEISGKDADDRVFDLTPSRQECDDASAAFDTGQ